MNIQKYICLLLLTAILMGCKSNLEPEKFPNPTSQKSSYPSLFSSGSELYMSWITDNNGQTHSLNYARYSNGNWSKTTTIATDSTWFVNWADFPTIIADSDGPVAANWLRLTETRPLAYDIKISTTNDSNKWSSAMIPHKDGTPTEHGFVSMIPWDSGTFLAVWLDGRQTEGRTADKYFNLDYAMTLRGALISTEGEIKESFLIDKSICDCCPTSLVKTEDGAIVAYRNRTDDEIRDIFVSRFDGKSWSNPKAVHNDGWEIGACPVNGPKLAAQGSTILVAWHTAADEDPTTKAAISTDGGQTFNKARSLNNQESLGRVDVAVHNGKAYVSWMESNSKDKNNAYLNVASFGISNSSVNKKRVAEINSSRQTGFPQMEILGNELIFAWTGVNSDSSEIKTKRLGPLPF
jgi:hypothetical protein